MGLGMLDTAADAAVIAAAQTQGLSCDAPHDVGSTARGVPRGAGWTTVGGLDALEARALRSAQVRGDSEARIATARPATPAGQPSNPPASRLIPRSQGVPVLTVARLVNAARQLLVAPMRHRSLGPVVALVVALLGLAVPAGAAAEVRHFERVSPADKGDGDIIAEGGDRRRQGRQRGDV